MRPYVPPTAVARMPAVACSVRKEILKRWIRSGFALRALRIAQGDQMSSGKRVGRNVVKPLVVAVALALPGTAAFAASMDDVVKTRADQNLDEQYGRDSVSAFSRDAKPRNPESQASLDMGFLGDAYHKRTGFVANAWHKTPAMFTGDGKTYAANQ